MGSKHISPKQKEHYNRLRREGWTRAAACRETGVSYSWAKEQDIGHVNSGQAYQAAKEAAEVPEGPLTPDELGEAAKRSLEDFPYFRQRYFGHLSVPWQAEAARIIVEALESPHKEFIVINCPPGSGKTTFFSYDIPAWLTVRNRAIRGLVGSHTAKVAAMYTGRLRRAFERTHPVKAKDRDLRLGLAVDAESTLAKDYGLFKPENPDIWTRDAFTVVQFGETPTDEKEATWTAFGQDSSSLGWRVEYIVWDDVVTPRILRSQEMLENQRLWWDDEAETRLEPTGVLVLQGQRLGSSDLYRYCLDKEIVIDLADEFDDDAPKRRQYHHIVFKAHYPEKCREKHHPRDARPYPDGCLLDPLRLPWRDLRAVMAKGQKFQVLYQQEDVDPEDALVQKIWVDGGKAADGVEYPGCWDRNRGSCEIPAGLTEPAYSIVTCDPSPTKYWSVQWWLYHPDSELRYFLDMERRPMDAPDFLDFDPLSNSYTGLLEEWWHRSKDRGRPFTHLIVEANAAQRFMLQYLHFKRWCALRGVTLIPHQTQRNKLDENYGVVASLKPVWRLGRVRLPGKATGADVGRVRALWLVGEVLKYPGGTTDDCCMAQWFLEYWLNRIAVPDRSKMPRTWRPSWFGKQMSGVR